jgi:hypothetical protein
MASTSWAFFIPLMPLIPRPPAICFSSGSSLPLSPPDERLERVPPAAAEAAAVVSAVSVT